MLEVLSQMNRLGKYILASMFVAWTFNLAGAADTSGTAKSQPAGTFQVKVSNGHLSLDASEAPLAEVLKELGKQAKITFESNVGPEEKITIRLDHLPLEDGIRQLSKNVTVFYTEDLKDKTPRITRVVVLSGGKGTAGRAKAAPEAIQREEPSPRSEPFKFEFDPAKSTEKKRPVKQP
jgi:type II secretory pathway component GspD/PulD (secretin)